jgi:hypothetical protein
VRGLASLLLVVSLPALAQVIGTPPPAVVQEEKAAFDRPQGIYATIDTQRNALSRLRDLIPTPRREAINIALSNPAALSPPVLYALANALSQDDVRIEEAVFWYHVGRIRAVFDGLRCKDASARVAVTILGRTLNPDIPRYQRQRRQRTLEIAQAAVDWDRKNPYGYDHRWINLYGKVARTSPGTDPDELTLPKSEWPAIHQHVHEAHLKSVQEFAAQK